MSTHPTNDQLQADQLQRLHEQLKADIELLQEKETNLKASETRLRALLERTSTLTATPFQSGRVGGTVGDLDAAWEKFHRSQALFEAERRAFKDERLLLREQQTALQAREAEVVRREAWLETCEREIAAVAATTVPAIPTPARRTLTTAPFLAVKHLFSRGS